MASRSVGGRQHVCCQEHGLTAVLIQPVCSLSQLRISTGLCRLLFFLRSPVSRPLFSQSVPGSPMPACSETERKDWLTAACTPCLFIEFVCLLTVLILFCLSHDCLCCSVELSPGFDRPAVQRLIRSPPSLTFTVCCRLPPAAWRFRFGRLCSGVWHQRFENAVRRQFISRLAPAEASLSVWREPASDASGSPIAVVQPAVRLPISLVATDAESLSGSAERWMKGCRPVPASVQRFARLSQAEPVRRRHPVQRLNAVQTMVRQSGERALSTVLWRLFDGGSPRRSSPQRPPPRSRSAGSIPAFC